MEKKDILLKIEELEQELANVKGTECEVYSRIVGYFRPVKQWNNGKQEEFSEREMFEVLAEEEKIHAS
jgi:ribonucleoside-triphosphate reductase